MLVVLLRRIELARGCDLGHDRPLERLGLLQRLLGLLGQHFLLLVMVEDGRSVLGTDVAELAIFHGRVDVVPKFI